MFRNISYYAWSFYDRLLLFFYWFLWINFFRIKKCITFLKSHVIFDIETFKQFSLLSVLIRKIPEIIIDLVIDLRIFHYSLDKDNSQKPLVYKLICCCILFLKFRLCVTLKNYIDYFPYYVLYQYVIILYLIFSSWNRILQNIT